MGVDPKYKLVRAQLEDKTTEKLGRVWGQTQKMFHIELERIMGTLSEDHCTHRTETRKLTVKIRQQSLFWIQ